MLDVDNANNFNGENRIVLGVRIPQHLADSEGVANFFFKFILKLLHARVFTK